MPEFMYGDLHRFVVATQERDWDRLSRAIDYAMNNYWSIEVSGIAGDIAEAARLVGPTPWKNITWPLFRGGVYATLLEVAGISFTPPSEQELARVDQMMAPNFPNVNFGDRYAKTCTALREKSSEWLPERKG